MTSHLWGNSVLGPPQFPVPMPTPATAGEPPRGAILSGDAAKELVAFNCNELRKASVSYWVPEAPDIDRLERGLIGFMSQQRTPSDYRPLHEYYRQYAGFTVKGRKYICVNFFHASSVETTISIAQRDPFAFKRLSEGGPPEDYWRRRPVVVMDGGAYYFTVTYEPATAKCSHLEFHGYA